jgi:hypothetical protein
MIMMLESLVSYSIGELRIASLRSGPTSSQSSAIVNQRDYKREHVCLHVSPSGH